MSEKILSTIYAAMKIDDESTDGYYIIQWTSGPCSLQEDKDTKDCTLLVTAYSVEVMCDVFKSCNK